MSVVTYHEHRLLNGLKIIGERRESSASVSMGFFVKTGARDETPEVSGVSHFLEHMLFKGTPKRNALELSQDIAAIGAQANAFTSEENTVYHLTFLPEYFEEAAEILSDMMRPSLDAEEFAMEKKVILEEIALYQDRPSYVAYEQTLQTHFSRHTAGNSVLGSIESISKLTVEQMREYFDARYAASNITLCVSGCFDWSQVVQAAQKHCSHWEKGSVARKYPEYSPQYVEKKLSRKPLHQTHIYLAAPGPSAQDPLRIPADVLACILGDGSGSRTYWELVDTGLAESAAVSFDTMDGVGVLFGYASCAPENAARVEEILTRIVSNPLPVTDAELRQAKTKIQTRLVFQGESARRRLFQVGLGCLYRDSYESIDLEVENIEAVSAQSLQEIIGRFPTSPVTKVVMEPEAETIES